MLAVHQERPKVSHEARADYGTVRLRGQRASLLDVQDCYDWANRCLDMWNESVDDVARSGLLRMADAWLQLASELDRSTSKMPWLVLAPGQGKF
jgi:hypothetical protein